MNTLHDRIERILPLVRNPAAYVGGEWNTCRKTLTPGRVRVALVFPDTYTVGMSHLGLQILYHVLNERDDVACERAFMPLPDMEERMRAEGIPLYSLETFTPLADFDVIAFSLQYEMTYTNVLAVLDLAGVPLRSADRSTDDPLVVAGGPGALNPEPLADFIDLFVVGDGEETAPLLVDAFKRVRSAPTRTDRLKALAAACVSFYVPTLYDVDYAPDDTLSKLQAACDGVPCPVRAAVVADLDSAPFPTRPVVPNTEVVHDRIALEIMRGCMHRCRFCQAGAARRPVRFRSVDRLVELAEASYAATGCDEISLTSLSSNDYPHLERLLAKLDVRFRPRGVSLSVPSLRVNEALLHLPELIARVRKSGLTFAPEAATPELAAIIRKSISLDDLTAAVREAYAAGWDLVKLYFMVGLPGERPADVDAIPEITRHVSRVRREVGQPPARVNVTVASFIPKPHTPFQWEPMASREYLEGVRGRLRQALRGGRVQLKFHDVRRSFLEAVFSRGDRRLGRVIESAWRLGARLDAWDEHFRMDLWEEAFRTCGIDPEFYATRRRADDELLPWSHIDVGHDAQALAAERDRARELILKRESE
ncbi:MAG TPA: TIGR03960 family B12-binding radical SAM protein [Planctomycetota bacterium]|nr:TIGR03960 family B12-binding radical SAM protein [Planctomycetota bacterium]